MRYGNPCFYETGRFGISNTSIDRVDYSDLENLKKIKRAKAVENAKAKAIALTKPINQSVGSAIHITDFENFPQPFQGKSPEYKYAETLPSKRNMPSYQKLILKRSK